MNGRAVGALAVVSMVLMGAVVLAGPAAQAKDQSAPADTVKVGKEIKKAVGRVTELVAGDVACYMTLRDDKGVEFQEMAEFEVCERTSLVGKRVALTYALEQVLADECQGDPDCGKSKTVALVKQVKVIGDRAAAGKR